jgi:uroporphyrin-3 C-methyltransferase
MSPASPLPDRTVADVAGRTPLPSPPTAGGAALARFALVAASLLALVALVIGLMLWQKVSGMQEQLARQSADALAQSLEARTLARQAQDTVRDTAARLSRSRDENLMVDVESTLRLALQQAQVTGNTGALLAALRTVDQRIARAAQPRLAPLQRALQRDADRLRASASGDGSEAMARLDELLRGIDDLPTVNALPARSGGATDAWQIEPIPDDAPMWQRILASVRNEARSLVRVGRIDRPESVLLSPDQAFFLRENLKLKLLGVRLSLMSRQVEPARSELAAVTASLNRYFDPSSRRVQVAATQLQQLQLQVRAVEPPRLDDTFAALSTAMAGR